MSKPEANFISGGEDAAISKFKLEEAEKDGTLQHCASVYDMENDMLVPGVGLKGQRVVDFANILKYNHIPLANTVRFLLRLFREAMGSPVEVEYAVDLEAGEDGEPTFYLLQIKPMIRREEQIKIDLGDLNKEKAVMFARQGMGNGHVPGIRDVVYVDPKKFDKLKTKEAAREIHQINKKMDASGTDYILVGPGRWGTNDPFTGIPVSWAQISRARIIIEMGLPDFPLDGSLGSHFFHNVTSMNVGYFSVANNSQDEIINIELLDKQPLVEASNFVRHVRFDQELTILMDGHSRQALISYDPD
jgi:hypothetical protein